MSSVDVSGVSLVVRAACCWRGVVSDDMQRDGDTVVGLVERLFDPVNPDQQTLLLRQLVPSAGDLGTLLCCRLYGRRLLRLIGRYVSVGSTLLVRHVLLQPAGCERGLRASGDLAEQVVHVGWQGLQREHDIERTPPAEVTVIDVDDETLCQHQRTTSESQVEGTPDLASGRTSDPNHSSNGNLVRSAEFISNVARVNAGIPRQIPVGQCFGEAASTRRVFTCPRIPTPNVEPKVVPSVRDSSRRDDSDCSSRCLGKHSTIHGRETSSEGRIASWLNSREKHGRRFRKTSGNYSKNYQTNDGRSPQHFSRLTNSYRKDALGNCREKSDRDTDIRFLFSSCRNKAALTPRRRAGRGFAGGIFADDDRGPSAEVCSKSSDLRHDEPVPFLNAAAGRVADSPRQHVSACCVQVSTRQGVATGRIRSSLQQNVAADRILSSLQQDVAAGRVVSSPRQDDAEGRIASSLRHLEPDQSYSPSSMYVVSGTSRPSVVGCLPRSSALRAQAELEDVVVDVVDVDDPDTNFDAGELESVQDSGGKDASSSSSSYSRYFSNVRYPREFRDKQPGQLNAMGDRYRLLRDLEHCDRPGSGRVNLLGVLVCCTSSPSGRPVLVLSDPSYTPCEPRVAGPDFYRDGFLLVAVLTADWQVPDEWCGGCVLRVRHVKLEPHRGRTTGRIFHLNQLTAFSLQPGSGWQTLASTAGLCRSVELSEAERWRVSWLRCWWAAVNRSSAKATAQESPDDQDLEAGLLQQENARDILSPVSGASGQPTSQTVSSASPSRAECAIGSQHPSEPAHSEATERDSLQLRPNTPKRTAEGATAVVLDSHSPKRPRLVREGATAGRPGPSARELESNRTAAPSSSGVRLRDVRIPLRSLNMDAVRTAAVTTTLCDSHILFSSPLTETQTSSFDGDSSAPASQNTSASLSTSPPNATVEAGHATSHDNISSSAHRNSPSAAVRCDVNSAHLPSRRQNTAHKPRRSVTSDLPVNQSVTSDQPEECSTGDLSSEDVPSSPASKRFLEGIFESLPVGSFGSSQTAESYSSGFRPNLRSGGSPSVPTSVVASRWISGVEGADSSQIAVNHRNTVPSKEQRKKPNSGSEESQQKPAPESKEPQQKPTSGPKEPKQKSTSGSKGPQRKPDPKSKKPRHKPISVSKESQQMPDTGSKEPQQKSISGSKEPQQKPGDVVDSLPLDDQLGLLGSADDLREFDVSMSVSMCCTAASSQSPRKSWVRCSENAAGTSVSSPERRSLRLAGRTALVPRASVASSSHPPTDSGGETDEASRSRTSPRQNSQCDRVLRSNVRVQDEVPSSPAAVADAHSSGRQLRSCKVDVVSSYPFYNEDIGLLSDATTQSQSTEAYHTPPESPNIGGGSAVVTGGTVQSGTLGTAECSTSTVVGSETTEDVHNSTLICSEAMCLTPTVGLSKNGTRSVAAAVAPSNQFLCRLSADLQRVASCSIELLRASCGGCQLVAVGGSCSDLLDTATGGLQTRLLCPACQVPLALSLHVPVSLHVAAAGGTSHVFAGVLDTGRVWGPMASLSELRAVRLRLLKLLRSPPGGATCLRVEHRVGRPLLVTEVVGTHVLRPSHAPANPHNPEDGIYKALLQLFEESDEA